VEPDAKDSCVGSKLHTTAEISAIYLGGKTCNISKPRKPGRITGGGQKFGARHSGKDSAATCMTDPGPRGTYALSPSIRVRVALQTLPWTGFGCYVLWSQHVINSVQDPGLLHSTSAKRLRPWEAHTVSIAIRSSVLHILQPAIPSNFSYEPSGSQLDLLDASG